MYDIIFISYNESNANENWQDLKIRFPLAKRIDKVKGIHQAHIAAAKKSLTKMFWVVDGDARILDTFNFDFKINKWDENSVYVWRSLNPVTELSYGYGGVKLLPKKLTENIDINTADMTTSISNNFHSIEEISNITVFNTDPFNTWKSAFRECVKLSSNIINRRNEEESLYRLKIWCTVGDQKPYGEYSIAGALAGNEYGLKYKDNLEMLSKINDWQWLENEFKKY